jgi:pimeloyl-ACP methyl ester carboxylesterase
VLNRAANDLLALGGDLILTGLSRTDADHLRNAGLHGTIRLTVADHVGATQALGVSMGAGALCTLLATTPLRFERLVFVMPAVLDRPRTDDAMDRLLEEAAGGVHGAVEGLAGPPLTNRAALAAVTVPALVIAQEQDVAHPVWVAEQLAGSLPNARLEIMPPGGILVRHRAVMRDLIGAFLSGEPSS